MRLCLHVCLRVCAQDKPSFDVEVAVIPPAPFLPIVAAALEGTVALLGAQDVFPQAKGAFTGEISPGMLSSLGTAFVLAGHSERRVLFKEDDEAINKKVGEPRNSTNLAVNKGRCWHTVTRCSRSLRKGGGAGTTCSIP